MADNSKIEWTDATWSPITGCSVESPGCKNCYAMKLAGGRLKNHPSRAGLTRPTKAGPVWTGEVRFNEGWLDQPLRWRRPRRIFVVAHGDLFHPAVPTAWIHRVFAVMLRCPNHIFQVLTKRPERMRNYVFHYFYDHADDLLEAVEDAGGDPDAVGVMAPNIWLGFSAENQEWFDLRSAVVRDLTMHGGWLTWCSAEPLLGPIDIDAGDVSAWLGWIVAGGESKDGARPMHPDWPQDLRDQCVAAGVPFSFKQWGDWAPKDPAAPQQDGDVFLWPDGTSGGGTMHQHGGPGVLMRHVGKKDAGRLLDGRTWDEMPEIG